MLFSACVKEEIAAFVTTADSRVRSAFADGVVYAAGSHKTIRTYSEEVAECLCLCLPNYTLTRKKTYSFLIEHERVYLDKYVNLANARSDALEREESADSPLLSAFAGGLFVACGAVSSPRVKRFLSLSVYNDDLMCLLRSCRFAFKNSDSRMYIKGGDTVADFLAFCGAGQGAMELMCSQIEKDRRLQANRAVNCDTANIDKSLSAGAAAIADIEYIFGQKGFSFLPPKLQVAAMARRDNPSATLNDLAALLGISKSGVSHRLSKISEAAVLLRHSPN